MGIPPKVRGTALTYFHRFYLHHSVMDAEPKSIMMAAVYVACKTEEHYIAAEDLARMAKQDPSIVLREELNLLNGINFDLIVHHPYRPLLGIQFLLHDLGGAAAGGDARGERGGGGDAHPFASTREGREETMRRARHAADAAMMTDAPLLFAPGLLALACFRLALREELSEERARSGFLLMARALRGQADDQQERTAAFLGALEAESAAEPGPCLAVLDDIEAYVRDGRAPVDQEAVREIDRQLKGCRNPVRNKDAEHYKRVHAKKFEVRRRRPRGPSIRVWLVIGGDGSPSARLVLIGARAFLARPRQEMETRRQQKQAAKRAAHDASMSALGAPPLPPEAYTAKRRKTATP